MIRNLSTLIHCQTITVKCNNFIHLGSFYFIKTYIYLQIYCTCLKYIQYAYEYTYKSTYIHIFYGNFASQSYFSKPANTAVLHDFPCNKLFITWQMNNACQTFLIFLTQVHHKVSYKAWCVLGWCSTDFSTIRDIVCHIPSSLVRWKLVMIHFLASKTWLCTEK